MFLITKLLHVKRQTYYSIKHDALSIIISAKTMSYLMLVPHSLYAPILSNPKATPALSFAASNQMTTSRRNIWQPVVQQQHQWELAQSWIEGDYLMQHTAQSFRALSQIEGWTVVSSPEQCCWLL